jgi:hypothetical protein
MSERLYNWLLKLYPPRFREEYGDAMRQVFRDRLRTEPLFRLWLDVVRDLAISVPREFRRPTASASEPGVYRFSDSAVRKMMSRGHAGLRTMLLPLVAGVLIAWAGDAQLWLSIFVYSLLALFLLRMFFRRGGVRGHWRGYEVVLEADRISYRNHGVVQVTINRSEIAGLHETGDFGLAILGPTVDATPAAPGVHEVRAHRRGPIWSAGEGLAIWAPAVLTGYAELRNRLAAWAPVTHEDVGISQGRMLHRWHVQMFLGSFYVSALLVRSHDWLFALASLCGAFLIFLAVVVLRDAGLPRFLKLIPFALLLLLATKVVFTLA